MNRLLINKKKLTSQKIFKTLIFNVLFFSAQHIHAKLPRAELPLFPCEKVSLSNIISVQKILDRYAVFKKQPSSDLCVKDITAEEFLQLRNDPENPLLILFNQYQISKISQTHLFTNEFFFTQDHNRRDQTFFKKGDVYSTNEAIISKEEYQRKRASLTNTIIHEFFTAEQYDAYDLTNITFQVPAHMESIVVGKVDISTALSTGSAVLEPSNDTLSREVEAAFNASA